MIDDNSGRAISTLWINASKDDIGSGFRRANRAVAREIVRRSKNRKNQRMEDVYRRIRYQEVNDQRVGRARHPFLNGSSRFIFYVLKPPKLKKEPVIKDVEKKVVNFQNKITARQRVSFVNDLGTNIEKTAKFFLEEILPKSQALLSAAQKVDEVTQQLTEEKAGLPIEFMKNKMREAINLRIIRHIASQYGLSKAEHKLLLGEFIAKSRRPLF